MAIPNGPVSQDRKCPSVLWKKVITLLMSASLLAACGIADSRAPVPRFMRAKEPSAPRLEAPPDIRRLVAEKLDMVFTAGSSPTGVRVSQPIHNPRGPGWIACVRAELTSVTGGSLGSQTYRIFINDGTIGDRQRVEADDECEMEPN
jgi:hypothetical protein